MRIQAGRPFKITLKNGGKKRVRWQVKFWARDEATGKLVEVARKTFESRLQAVDAIPRLVRDYAQTQGRIRTGEKMTFSDLVAVARETFYAPATVRNGQTIEGVRSHRPIGTQLKNLEAYFSKYRLTSISKADISGYRKARLKEGSRRGKSKIGAELSLSTLNRELATLRRLLRHAENEGWILRSPFVGARLINSSAELERKRVLSKAEETLLLAVCEPGIKQLVYRRRKRGSSELQTISAAVETGNPELKAAVLLALDCGLRQGELLKLSWGDIDMSNGTAAIQGTHTKTQRGRSVPLTDRVLSELERLPSFGGIGNLFRNRHLKRSWNTARKLAQLEGLRFHDLRRSAASRMIATGVALQFVGKTLGHAQLSTTAKYYVSVDAAMLDDIRQKMNVYNNATGDSAEQELERVN